MEKIRLAVIGQGRSGRDIHGKFLRSESNTLYEVKYVVEADAERRERALEEYPGCVVFESVESLLPLSDIDLVVNASFSEMHYETTKALLKSKKNVLVEKPFARTRLECEDLINTAKENGVLLTVFHQSLVAPFFLQAKEIINKGLIGEPKVINLRYNGLARRWDWQTLQKKVAGSVYNTGPHPLGMAMDLLGFDPNIRVEYSYLDCALTSGDGEDVAKIILSAPGKPVVDVEINSIDGFCDYNIKVQGTRGTIKANTAKCMYKYIVDGENPERPVIEETLRREDGTPMYCSEQLNIHEEEVNISGSVFGESVAQIYENIYYAIKEGRELIVKPENIAQLIGVIETVHATNPLPLKY